MLPNPLSSKPSYSRRSDNGITSLRASSWVRADRWHTFRHTYWSRLDETGAPMKIQQELMRHASIQTTMNVYGQAMPESKRAANGKVVTMVLKPLRASA